MQLVLRTNCSVDYVQRQIQEMYGRLQSISLYTGELTQKHNCVLDTAQTLGNLLQTYGGTSKAAAEAFELVYDFQPHNAQEPLLLAIN